MCQASHTNPYSSLIQNIKEEPMEILKEKVAELEAQNAALIEGVQSAVE